MNKTNLIHYLSQTPGLSPEKASTIAEHFEYRHLEKGELFLKEGKVADEYLFLEKGFMRTYLFDTEGNEITLSFYAAPDLVFEVSSFFQRIPSMEYFEATTDCDGWVLTYTKLNGLFHGMPEFREFGRGVLVRGFIAFKHRTLSMINKTAEERYLVLMQTKPEIFQHAQLKHIASYLGVTDTSLSRIRKTFPRK